MSSGAAVAIVHAIQNGGRLRAFLDRSSARPTFRSLCSVGLQYLLGPDLRQHGLVRFLEIVANGVENQTLNKLPFDFSLENGFTGWEQYGNIVGPKMA